MLQLDYPATQSPIVKQAIALSLGQLSELRAIDALIQLLADPDARVKLHVIRALKNLGSEAAHWQLQQLATKEVLAPDLKQGVADRSCRMVNGVALAVVSWLLPVLYAREICCFSSSRQRARNAWLRE